MVLSQQVAELKYSPFTVIPFERGPQTGMRWKENQAWSTGTSRFVIYLLLCVRHLLL